MRGRVETPRERASPRLLQADSFGWLHFVTAEGAPYWANVQTGQHCHGFPSLEVLCFP